MVYYGDAKRIYLVDLFQQKIVRRDWEQYSHLIFR